MGRTFLITVLTALLLPVLAGCGKSGQSTGTASAHRGWTGGLHSASWEVATPDPVPGIDHGRAAFVGSGDFAVLFWTDLNSGGAGISSTGAPARLSVEGNFESSELKKPIDFQCQKHGPESGLATVDRVEYDLANGSLFLISTKGERPIVKQLHCDVSWLEFDDYVTELKTLAKNHPEISAFFEAPEKEKPAR
jgi:hypothetical protein